MPISARCLKTAVYQSGDADPQRQYLRTDVLDTLYSVADNLTVLASYPATTAEYHQRVFRDQFSWESGPIKRTSGQNSRLGFQTVEWVMPSDFSHGGMTEDRLETGDSPREKYLIVQMFHARTYRST
jgi:hypothetical protein